MDFSIVKRQIIMEYLKLYGDPHDNNIWSLKDCLDVFRYFYAVYKDRLGVDHPKLTNKTIGEIIEKLPYADIKYQGGGDFEPSDYEGMIQSYFDQPFENCDYSIAHFMSGQIRELRYYETVY